MNKSNPKLADMVITEAMHKNMQDVRDALADLLPLVYMPFDRREDVKGKLNHFDATMATIEGMMK